MKRIVCIAWTIGLATFAWQTPAQASDPIGAYALIDKVVLEPNAEAPERVQVWGAFTFAKVGDGDTYLAPSRGYLYYRTVKGKEDICRKEWKDMKKVAGTGEVIGLGSRYHLATLGTVRATHEKAEKPDPYPLGMGLVRVRRGTDYSPVRNLVALPVPKTPADGATINPGEVTLAIRNSAGPGPARNQYIFELVNAAGQKEKSEPIAAGEKGTKWTPRMRVKPGEKYRWNVLAVDGEWKGPAATSTFQGKARP